MDAANQTSRQVTSIPITAVAAPSCQNVTGNSRIRVSEYRNSQVSPVKKTLWNVTNQKSHDRATTAMTIIKNPKVPIPAVASVFRSRVRSFQKRNAHAGQVQNPEDCEQDYRLLDQGMHIHHMLDFALVVEW